MLTCTFEHGEQFAKIIDAVKELCTEGNLDFTANGLYMQVMDSAHVSLCSLTLQTNNFATYACSENVSLGLNFKTLSMVLRGVKGTLTLQHAQSSDTLTVIAKKLNGTATYNMKLMDIDSEQLGIPDNPHEAICTLPSATFTKVIKDFSDFSDACKIHIDEQLHISVKGNVGNVLWHSEDAKCSVQQHVQPLEFATRYMAIFSKASSVSQSVILGMTREAPICITYPLEHGFLRYYLAPKTMD